MIMKVAGKTQKVSLEICLIGLRKDNKIRTKIEMYETHIKNGTLPPIILVDGKFL
ncbi:putative transposase [Bacillus anthracis]|nr:putative transposase [Bacillus anthracis]